MERGVVTPYRRPSSSWEILATPLLSAGGLRAALVRLTLVTFRRGQVHDVATVLLKLLATQHLGEEVGGVKLGRHVGDRDHPGAAELPHLKELAVDVAGVRSRAEPVA